MKKLSYFITLILLAIAFYGCPVGLKYSLGDPGKEKINEKLIGKWVTGNTDAEVKNLSISKNDNFSYNVYVGERGETYSLTTDTLKGWITQLEGNTFFYVKPSNEDTYYHYFIKELSNNTLSTCDMTLLDGGVDAVTSSEELRNQVIKSMRRSDFCEEPIKWTKK